MEIMIERVSFEVVVAVKGFNPTLDKLQEVLETIPWIKVYPSPMNKGKSVITIDLNKGFYKLGENNGNT